MALKVSEKAHQYSNLLFARATRSLFKFYLRKGQM